MKKLVLIISAIVLLTACSKKQDAKPPLTPQNATIKDLIGNWLAVTDTNVTTVNGQIDTAINNNPNGARLQFNADNSGIIATSATDTEFFTYKLSDGIITIHVPATGNNAAIDIPFIIIEITAKKLIVRLSEGYTTEDAAYTKN